MNIDCAMGYHERCQGCDACACHSAVREIRCDDCGLLPDSGRSVSAKPGGVLLCEGCWY